MRRFALTLLLTTLPGVAQPPAKYSATVKLLMSGGSSDGDSLTNEFSSFLGRELRSLGDISVGDDKPDYVINVIVLKLLSRGSPIGFSAATLITRPENAEILADPALKLRATLEGWQLFSLAIVMSRDVSVIKFNLKSGSLDDIQSTCQEIIADFDTNTLNAQRVLWHSLHKAQADMPK